MRAAAWSAFGTRETRHYAEYWLVAERESDSSTRRHILVNAKFHAEARDASANMCEETEEKGRPLARRDYPTLSMGDDSQKRKQTNNRSNKRATYTTCIVSNVSSEERERENATSRGAIKLESRRRGIRENDLYVYTREMYARLRP